MQLGVNKCQRAVEATDLPSLVNPRAGLPTNSGFESSHVGLINDESTDQIEGIAPIPIRVQPEPRRP